MKTERLAFVFCILLEFAPRGTSKILLRSTPSSWLALEAQPVCTLPASVNFSGLVQVFVHQDNTRHLEFGDAWSGTQTTVSCKGSLPSSCLAHFKEDGPAPDCDHIECPCDRDVTKVHTDYLAQMAAVIVPMCQTIASPLNFTVLNIGLGGGDIPAYLLSHCPANTRVESVEFDPRVVTVANKFFGTLDAHDRHHVDTDDGGAAVAKLLNTGKRYDAILVDVFDDSGNVPASCLGDSFTANAYELLRPAGKIVQQVWEKQHGVLLNSFKRSFRHGGVVSDGDVQHGQWVVTATKGPAN